jgi:5-(hydroxymethyl)furfural/furfural oxidase
VADASVFPEVPRANTNLPTIAAAERLSDLMRGARSIPARQVVGEPAPA